MNITHYYKIVEFEFILLMQKLKTTFVAADNVGAGF